MALIITSEVNIPNTYWPWPVFPQFSGKLQDTIAVSAGRVKRPAHRNQGEWENYFRQPGSWDQVTSCDPDPKHKPDPGLGFHFQFLNSLSHQIDFLKTEDWFSIHNSISVLILGSFWRRIMEVDLAESIYIQCMRCYVLELKVTRVMGEGITASNLPGKHPSWLHLPGLNSMNVLWDVRCENIRTFSGISWRSDTGSRCEMSLAEEREELCWHQVNVGVRILTGSQTLGMETSGSICGIRGSAQHRQHTTTHREPPCVTHVSARTQVWRQFNDKKVNLFCHLSLFPLLLVNLLWLECDSSYP